MKREGVDLVELIGGRGGDMNNNYPHDGKERMRSRCFILSLGMKLRGL